MFHHFCNRLFSSGVSCSLHSSRHMRRTKNTLKIIRKSFSVFSKGNGVYGALGQGDSLRDSTCYNEVLSCNIISLSAGWGHSVAVTETGNLLVFGRPFDFSNIMQLNRLSKISKTFAQFVSRSTNSGLFGSTLGYYPSPIVMEGVENVQSVSCSAGLTLVRTCSGAIYAFGLNRWRQCGVDFEKEDMMHLYEPKRVFGLPPCVDSDTGLQHCIVLTNEGEVHTWGKSNHGQLGRGLMNESFALCGKVVLVDDASRERPLIASHVCGGFSHSAVIGVNGEVYVWGKGLSDKQKKGSGIRQFEDQLFPRRVDLPDGRLAINIVSSNFNIVIVANDRSLWAMGLGEHDRNMSNVPLRVQTDFHSEDGHRRGLDLQIAVESNTIFVELPEDAVLRKGYNRVSLVLPSERRVIENNSTICGTYDVVIHNNEAYILELEVGSFNFITPARGQNHYKIRDYAGGWQHSLLSL